MSRHEGVSCDSCLKSNFRGRRYKCLICYDYDLCAQCYEEGVTSTRHSADHPMQCILTRTDFDLYYGGEVLTPEQPQSFTCPYCKRMGFSDSSLLDHVNAEHSEGVHLEVVCPVCAAQPGGDPNLVTDDFAGHLTLEHRTGPRDLISFLDEPSAIRHGGVRRIPHSGRALGGPRSRRSNMHFSSSSGGGLSTLSPSGRESVDPIAELLQQLSGARRGAPQPSQLQQLQMQIQLERQQVTAARQQLERLPRRQAHPANAVASTSSAGAAAAAPSAAPGTSSGAAASTSSANAAAGVVPQANGFQSTLTLNANNLQFAPLSSSSPLSLTANAAAAAAAAGGAASTAGTQASTGTTTGSSGSSSAAAAPGAQSDSDLLLPRFFAEAEQMSEEEQKEWEKERVFRALFVGELMLSTLSHHWPYDEDGNEIMPPTAIEATAPEATTAVAAAADAAAAQLAQLNLSDAGSGGGGLLGGAAQAPTPETPSEEHPPRLAEDEVAEQMRRGAHHKSSRGSGGSSKPPPERRGRPPPSAAKLKAASTASSVSSKHVPDSR